MNEEEEEDTGSLGVGKYPCMPSLVALQQMRNRLHLAFLGKRLMKWTATATFKELRKLAAEIVEVYKDFDERVKLAYISIARTHFHNNQVREMVLENIEPRACVTVNTTSRNVTGVRVIQFGVLEEENDPYNYLGIGLGGQSVKETKERWRDLLRSMIYILQLRDGFLTLEAANKAATKKHNVLGKLVIPKITVTIEYILSEIEERSREDNFRIKRFTQWKARKKEKMKAKICACCHDMFKEENKFYISLCPECTKFRSAEMHKNQEFGIITCGNDGDKIQNYLRRLADTQPKLGLHIKEMGFLKDVDINSSTIRLENYSTTFRVTDLQDPEIFVCPGKLDDPCCTNYGSEYKVKPGIAKTALDTLGEIESETDFVEVKTEESQQVSALTDEELMSDFKLTNFREVVASSSKQPDLYIAEELSVPSTPIITTPSVSNNNIDAVIQELNESIDDGISELTDEELAKGTSRIRVARAPLGGSIPEIDSAPDTKTNISSLPSKDIHKRTNVQISQVCTCLKCDGKDTDSVTLAERITESGDQKNKISKMDEMSLTKVCKCPKEDQDRSTDLVRKAAPVIEPKTKLIQNQLQTKPCPKCEDQTTDNDIVSTNTEEEFTETNADSCQPPNTQQPKYDKDDHTQDSSCDLAPGSLKNFVIKLKEQILDLVGGKKEDNCTCCICKGQDLENNAAEKSAPKRQPGDTVSKIECVCPTGDGQRSLSQKYTPNKSIILEGSYNPENLNKVSQLTEVQLLLPGTCKCPVETNTTPTNDLLDTNKCGCPVKTNPKPATNKPDIIKCVCPVEANPTLPTNITDTKKCVCLLDTENADELKNISKLSEDQLISKKCACPVQTHTAPATNKPDIIKCVCPVEANPTLPTNITDTKKCVCPLDTENADELKNISKLSEDQLFSKKCTCPVKTHTKPANDFPDSKKCVCPTETKPSPPKTILDTKQCVCLAETKQKPPKIISNTKQYLCPLDIKNTDDLKTISKLSEDQLFSKKCACPVETNATPTNHIPDIKKCLCPSKTKPTPPQIIPDTKKCVCPTKTNPTPESTIPDKTTAKKCGCPLKATSISGDDNKVKDKQCICPKDAFNDGLDTLVQLKNISQLTSDQESICVCPNSKSSDGSTSAIRNVQNLGNLTQKSFPAVNIIIEEQDKIFMNLSQLTQDEMFHDNNECPKCEIPKLSVPSKPNCDYSKCGGMALVPKVFPVNEVIYDERYDDNLQNFSQLTEDEIKQNYIKYPKCEDPKTKSVPQIKECDYSKCSGLNLRNSLVQKSFLASNIIVDQLGESENFSQLTEDEMMDNVVKCSEYGKPAPPKNNECDNSKCGGINISSKPIQKSFLASSIIFDELHKSENFSQLTEDEIKEKGIKCPEYEKPLPPKPNECDYLKCVGMNLNAKIFPVSNIIYEAQEDNIKCPKCEDTKTKILPQIKECDYSKCQGLNKSNILLQKCFQASNIIFDDLGEKENFSQLTEDEMRKNDIKCPECEKPAPPKPNECDYSICGGIDISNKLIQKSFLTSNIIFDELGKSENFSQLTEDEMDKKEIKCLECEKPVPLKPNECDNSKCGGMSKSNHLIQKQFLASRIIFDELGKSENFSQLTEDEMNDEKKIKCPQCEKLVVPKPNECDYSKCGGMSKSSHLIQKSFLASNIIIDPIGKSENFSQLTEDEMKVNDIKCPECEKPAPPKPYECDYLKCGGMNLIAKLFPVNNIIYEAQDDGVKCPKCGNTKTKTLLHTKECNFSKCQGLNLSNNLLKKSFLASNIVFDQLGKSENFSQLTEDEIKENEIKCPECEKPAPPKPYECDYLKCGGMNLIAKIFPVNNIIYEEQNDGVKCPKCGDTKTKTLLHTKECDFSKCQGLNLSNNLLKKSFLASNIVFDQLGKSENFSQLTEDEIKENEIKCPECEKPVLPKPNKCDYLKCEGMNISNNLIQKSFLASNIIIDQLGKSENFSQLTEDEMKANDIKCPECEKLVSPKPNECDYLKCQGLYLCSNLLEKSFLASNIIFDQLSRNENFSQLTEDEVKGNEIKCPECEKPKLPVLPKPNKCDYSICRGIISTAKLFPVNEVIYEEQDENNLHNFSQLTEVEMKQSEMCLKCDDPSCSASNDIHILENDQCGPDCDECQTQNVALSMNVCLDKCQPYCSSALSENIVTGHKSLKRMVEVQKYINRDGSVTEKIIIKGSFTKPKLEMLRIKENEDKVTQEGNPIETLETDRKKDKQIVTITKKIVSEVTKITKNLSRDFTPCEAIVRLKSLSENSIHDKSVEVVVNADCNGTCIPKSLQNKADICKALPKNKSASNVIIKEVQSDSQLDLIDHVNIRLGVRNEFKKLMATKGDNDLPTDSDFENFNELIYAKYGLSLWDPNASGSRIRKSIEKRIGRTKKTYFIKDEFKKEVQRRLRKCIREKTYAYTSDDQTQPIVTQSQNTVYDLPDTIIKAIEMVKASIKNMIYSGSEKQIEEKKSKDELQERKVPKKSNDELQEGKGPNGHPCTGKCLIKKENKLDKLENFGKSCLNRCLKKYGICKNKNSCRSFRGNKKADEQKPESADKWPPEEMTKAFSSEDETWHSCFSSTTTSLPTNTQEVNLKINLVGPICSNTVKCLSESFINAKCIEKKAMVTLKDIKKDSVCIEEIPNKSSVCIKNIPKDSSVCASTTISSQQIDTKCNKPKIAICKKCLTELSGLDSSKVEESSEESACCRVCELKRFQSQLPKNDTSFKCKRDADTCTTNQNSVCSSSYICINLGSVEASMIDNCTDSCVKTCTSDLKSSRVETNDKYSCKPSISGEVQYYDDASQFTFICDPQKTCNEQSKLIRSIMRLLRSDASTDPTMGSSMDSSEAISSCTGELGNSLSSDTGELLICCKTGAMSSAKPVPRVSSSCEFTLFTRPNVKVPSTQSIEEDKKDCKKVKNFTLKLKSESDKKDKDFVLRLKSESDICDSDTSITTESNKKPDNSNKRRKS